MATLHVKTPNGTTKSINLETMNITRSGKQTWGQWVKLPDGLILQSIGWVNTATFPIAFASHVFGVFSECTERGGWPSTFVQIICRAQNESIASLSGLKFSEIVVKKSDSSIMYHDWDHQTWGTVGTILVLGY